MNGFYTCSTELFELSKSTAKVFSFLHMVKNNQTSSSFYKRENIALHCGISESTVVRAIRELTKKGLLEVRKRFDRNGRQTTNRYILIENPLMKMEPESPHNGTEHAYEETDSQCKEMRSAASQRPIRAFKCSPSLFQQHLTATELKIYSYLSFRAGTAKSCKPSKKTIAADCNVSVSTVFRAVKKLCAYGLIEVISLTRKKIYGNNGTSVNQYIIKEPAISNTTQSTVCWQIKRLLCAFFSALTPSPISWVTPHRTISRSKVTLKQRKNTISTKVVKRYRLHNISFRERCRVSLAKTYEDTG